MSTHPIERADPEPPSLTDARVRLVESIMAAKTSPAHQSCIYTFGPYADWLRAVSESPNMAAFHLRAAAERLAFALHHDGHREDLRAFALYVVQLAMDAPASVTEETS